MFKTSIGALREKWLSRLQQMGAAFLFVVDFDDGGFDKLGFFRSQNCTI